MFMVVTSLTEINVPLAVLLPFPLAGQQSRFTLKAFWACLAQESGQRTRVLADTPMSQCFLNVQIQDLMGHG